MATHPIAQGRLAARAKKGVHAALLRANLDLVRNPPLRRLVKLSTMLEVGLVIDVGANIGQFASGLRASGFSGHIVSFEPLGDAFEQLRAAAANDPGWDVEHAAVGDEAGTVTINRAANSYSSSLLPMTDAHESAAPDSRIVGSETVPVDTLDALLDQRGLDPSAALLKIDTQGYESAVLAGASKTLEQIALVKLELSMVELYAGQVLFAELQDSLLSCGFTMCGVEEGFSDPRTGQMLQFDATFARSATLETKNLPSMSTRAS